MKRILLVVLAILTILPAAMADDKKKKAAAKKPAGIDWISWDEAQKRMKKKPKKVWVDVYTDWCGWCKVMDKKTFSNPDVIKYMNEHFYSIKFNSEKDDSIRLLDKLYIIQPENKVNDLAIQLMRGNLTYPSFIFMDENFTEPVPIPGYHPVTELEMILKFVMEGRHKKGEELQEYQKTFTPTWKEAEAKTP
jgi:thioredoxin-related protein